MNKKQAERINIPLKKIIGRPYSEFHSKKISEFFRKDANEVIRKGHPITREHKSEKDNKYYLRTFSPVKNEKGEVLAVNVISKDISELKQVENKLKESEQEIHKFAEYLQAAREKERESVASELHDEVGQALTGLKMDIFALKNKLSKDQKEIPSEFQKMEKLLDDSIQKLRKIYSELRPSLLEHFGVGEAMKQYVADFQGQSGTQCTFYQDPEEIILEENCSLALYRILQGAINNIKWHAQASKVNIRLEEKGQNLKLTIRDNGKGITEKQINGRDSFGLIGMRERARFLRGKLEIKGIPDKGTTVKIKIPLEQKN
jgi:signal transduction histidine kinase